METKEQKIREMAYAIYKRRQERSSPGFDDELHNWNLALYSILEKETWQHELGGESAK